MIVRHKNNEILTSVVGIFFIAILLTFAAVSGAAQQAAPLPDARSAWQQGDAGWLGIGIEDVTSQQATELKLPAVRGVFISRVLENSPAAKAGLQKGDVVTEYNGQRVEGVLQFRRLVRETPPGQTAQLTVWRDGHAVKLTATTGSMPVQLGNGWGRESNRFSGRMQRPFPFNGGWWRDFTMPRWRFGPGTGNSTPLLGVSAEDLSGQLGAYFGAPDDQGVLVTDVHQGSPAQKAGVKAGDVITALNGQPVRNIGELRMRLRDTRNDKSVTLRILRKGAEMSLSVTPEQPRPIEPLSPFNRRIST